MEEITLQALLEAGCHFGHKSERWHPKASEFIYTEKDGIHIIDLAKTKIGLEKAMEYVKKTIADGGEVLFVGTKRQAQGVVKTEAEFAGAPYFVERWIGGFLTNWDSIKKNIERIIRLTDEEATGAWKKFPKHEQSKLSRYLGRLRISYGGVLKVGVPPQALFVVDIKKEIAAVREAKRLGAMVVAIVDTNADPNLIDYVIPANDDAVGSIQFITHAIARAYKEGRDQREKELARVQNEQTKKNAEAEKKVEKPVEPVTVNEETISKSEIEEVVEKVNTEPAEEKAPVEPVKPKSKRGRPKKTMENPRT